ncbi:MAG TPA: hypothetical protein VE053_12380 [Allosphingosinicella sp.]|nr:hypothetical protein [Allosphingosinicella sp.]
MAETAGDTDPAEEKGFSRLWGCGFALLLIAGVAMIVGYGVMTGYLPIRSFDPALWRQVRTADNHDRLRMVEWLLRSGQLDGLTRSQAVGLLGQPDGGPHFQDWSLVYWLGPERGLFSIDSEWLVIRIGPDGRVAEYRVVRD